MLTLNPDLRNTTNFNVDNKQPPSSSIEKESIGSSDKWKVTQIGKEFIRSMHPGYGLSPEDKNSGISFKFNPKEMATRMIETVFPTVRIANTALEMAGFKSMAGFTSLMTLISSIPATGAQTSAATPSQASTSNLPATGAQTSAATPSQASTSNLPATGAQTSAATPSQASTSNLPATGAQTSAATPSQASTSNLPATGAQTSAATPSLQNNTTSVSSSEHTPSQANVTLINNTSDFKEIATSTQTLAGRYKLTQHLDIRDVSPIGNKTNPFTGQFDGNGHTIKTNHAVFGRVDGGEVSNVTIEDSHLECNPDAYTPYCRESLLIDELTGNSTVTDNTIKNSSVTCNHASTCSALINRMEVNPFKKWTPHLKGNHIIGSNITVNEVSAVERNLASAGVAQVDIVVKDGENQLTPWQLKNSPPPHISGIYSDNNTISGNPEPVNGGITIGSVRYIAKSYTTSDQYTEAGFIPNGTEKIDVYKTDLPTSDNPANSWAKLILDKPSTCNTNMNGEIFNQNCRQQTACPPISPALPPAVTPDANYTLPPAVTPDANYTLPPAVTPDANYTL
uniref:hypothetical protein n=1 Tax=uncultured Endozoicomonas sp. TaxID=432652 RepID=UPI00261BFB70